MKDLNFIPLCKLREKPSEISLQNIQIFRISLGLNPVLKYFRK